MIEGGRPLGFERSESEKNLGSNTMLKREVPSNIRLIYIEILIHIYIYRECPCTTLAREAVRGHDQTT
jgi:hypothetical protein